MAARTMSGSGVAGGSTKDAIREAAIRLFSAKGFEQTSLREVADAVGITKASLYYHYASKLDLLIAIVEPAFDDLGSVVEGLGELTYGPEGVREVLARQLRAMLRHRTASVMAVRDTVAIINAIGNRYPDMLANHRRLTRWLAGPDPSPEALLRASSALEVVSTVLWSQELAPEADEDMIERVLLDAALGVLAGGAGAPSTNGSGRAHHR
ncbi:TetR/AcrR family transcriptional regulator [Nocardia terpenica]|uniref:Transcriptional regulator n=1 Tax=Nocardia terpenica TaxID=455432 RepID=A0A164HE58_9NOCA|nr:TetR/AcrR family transcriptional regulator [Nocardia terpenica]KZM68435.1 transcriptional regulator [Nocardia terpenica]MBF6065006.1 TetR/AcrR family transcriptional regulator [Nocardia terpenica]MBF6108063.1 TetR/AcrR family transcriptional regulator [Nocardia terpenica]MBF6115278.1 TetR/AcrR family transcriptional regulator [Nocardia terpenica]MBF6122600.1 TetR/AcrR family transcriptional regulator [Nocardia terpenica]